MWTPNIMETEIEQRIPCIGSQPERDQEDSSFDGSPGRWDIPGPRVCGQALGWHHRWGPGGSQKTVAPSWWRQGPQCSPKRMIFGPLARFHKPLPHNHLAPYPLVIAGSVHQEVQKEGRNHSGARPLGGWRVQEWEGHGGWWDATAPFPKLACSHMWSCRAGNICEAIQFLLEREACKDSCDSKIFLRHRIAAIKAQCAKVKGWIRFLNCSRDSIDLNKLCSCCSFAHIPSADTRKDYYEKNKNVYWVEGQLKGRRLTLVRNSFTESNCLAIPAEFIPF